MSDLTRGVFRSRAVRLYMALFLTFLAANAFLVWSAPAWFGVLGRPPGLVNPVVDDLLTLVAPIALAVAMVQFPAWAMVEVFRGVCGFELPTALTITSSLSAAFYTALVPWLPRCRRYRGERLWAEYRRGL